MVVVVVVSLLLVVVSVAVVEMVFVGSDGSSGGDSCDGDCVRGVGGGWCGDG